MTRKWSVLFSILMILALVLGVNVTSASAQTTYVTYVVQPGDTLRTIAAQYCTTWNAIYDINMDTIGSNPNIIQVGMVLTVPANCTPAGTVVDKGPMTHATGYYYAPYYTVAWGDNLSSIGVRFGVPWQDIAAANGLNGTTIYAGQVLLIPSGPVTTPPPQQAPAERVYFAPGATSATKNGVISQGVPKSYILWANGGQTMTVSTVSSGEPLVISVGNTSGDLLPLTGVNSQVSNSVSAVLPASGDYIVTVRPKTPPESPSLNFTITFVIK